MIIPVLRAARPGAERPDLRTAQRLQPDCTTASGVDRILCWRRCRIAGELNEQMRGKHQCYPSGR